MSHINVLGYENGMKNRDNFDLDIYQQHIDGLNIEDLNRELIAIENTLNNGYKKPEGRLREKIRRITKKILELS